jgi:hypothetical protein
VLVLACALAQGGDRDRDPADTMHKARARAQRPVCGWRWVVWRSSVRCSFGQGLSLRPAGWTAPVGLPVAAGAQQQPAGDAASSLATRCRARYTRVVIVASFAPKASAASP